MIYLNDHLDDLDLTTALAQLSEQRRQQVLAFKHEAGQRQSAAAYLLLRQGLSELFGITEPPLFSYSEGGKPYITGHADIHFNLSHCRVAAACAIDTQPVGIDIEAIRPFREPLARHVLSDEEYRQVTGSDRPDAAFIRLWTMKESALKLTGEGIRTDLKTVLQRDDLLFSTVETPRYTYTLCQYRH